MVGRGGGFDSAQSSCSVKPAFHASKGVRERVDVK